ncbi:MAG: DNA repair protein RecN [Cytophagales bacterium]|nr:DNA repair protein RecN [Cytophagales bacterium]
MAIHRLILRDFVIVRALELDLSSGFTALTGETGAGKSILIDAIQMALGERANSGVVREGAAKADVAIEFDRTPQVDAWLEASGFELTADDAHLLVRRTVDTAGKSRAWINGSAATAAQLRELAEYLVDIHGQHAWAMLTRPDAVRDLLDAYAQIDKKIVTAAWDTWRAALAQLDLAKSGAATQAQERERLEWQINEVDKLKPIAGEWEEMNLEHGRLSNAQNLMDAAAQAITALDGGESDMAHHARSHLHTALQALQAQSHIEQSFQGICDELASSLAQVEDAVHSLQAYLRKTDLEPERLAQLDARILDWLSLARRFKCAPDALHSVLAKWRESLSQLEAMTDLGKLAKEERAAYAVFENAAQLVSKKRASAAPLLSSSITAAMQELGMKGGRFEVALARQEMPAAYGFESIEFLVAGHAGTTPKPVGRVASGGELSRIALAIAVTTSKLGNAPTLIFDEVDAGIGGAAAQTVGKLMQQLGADRQVLAVTHLPQVASQAHHHGVVSKRADDQANDGAPSSHVVMIDAADRVAEIARMLGGTNITDAARQHAKEMLKTL